MENVSISIADVLVSLLLLTIFVAPISRRTRLLAVVAIVVIVGQHLLSH